MPEQTYNIGYGSNDFFYNSNNEELSKTIPFNKEKLVSWAQKYDTSITSSANINVFDPKITAVVFVNKDAFINNYLPGNIVINNLSNFSDFTEREINLNRPADTSSKYMSPSLTSGKITIQSSMSMPETKYDLSINNPETKLEYGINSVGSLSNDISLNGVISKAEMPYIEPNGSISYISVNTANPRCKYQKGCTVDHWHYSSCTTQTFINKDGTSYCKCVCTGPKVKNNAPHDHCSPFNISQTKADGSVNRDFFQASLAALIKKITVSIKKSPDTYAFTGSNGNLTYPYQNFDKDFNSDDLATRTLIYNYYYELNRNIQMRQKIIANDSLDDSASQALLDANVKYKKEYLHLFNIFSGILFVSGYIYVMNKSQPK
jgi:hypothetical protein